jgi:hypothetical protein
VIGRLSGWLRGRGDNRVGGSNVKPDAWHAMRGGRRLSLRHGSEFTGQYRVMSGFALFNPTRDQPD